MQTTTAKSKVNEAPPSWRGKGYDGVEMTAGDNVVYVDQTWRGQVLAALAPSGADYAMVKWMDGSTSEVPLHCIRKG